jgi:DNA-binding GntR family transcriptional regulator
MTERERITKDRGREALSTRVYRSLVARLRSGELAPGSRLREEDVAAELGVSRTPVREALARLQARGLAGPTSLGVAVVELDRRQIGELYAMRAVLEGAAARFAADNASAGDLALLRHAAEAFAALREDAADLARANAFFHEAIYQAARNDYLNRMLEDMNDSLALLPRTTFTIPGRSEEAKAEHAAILAAIEGGDGDRAEKAARAHINKALEGRLKLHFSLLGA